MAPEFAFLEIENPADHIRLIRIARPKVLNAVNTAVLQELRAALGQVDSSRVLILTGSGDKAFVAGSDIQELANMTPDQALEFSQLGQGVCRQLSELPCPVVAMVNGHALGSGTELALACDLIIASDRATFGLPETTLGLIPGHGGTARMRDRVGQARAKEWIFSSRRLTAQEAFQAGLANQVVAHDQLWSQTLTLAQTMASKSPAALTAAKRLLNVDLESALQAESAAFAQLFHGADPREGLSAFLEKRSPRF